LLAYRELDDALGLTDLAGAAPLECRRGKNTRHMLTGLDRLAASTSQMGRFETGWLTVPMLAGSAEFVSERRKHHRSHGEQHDHGTAGIDRRREPRLLYTEGARMDRAYGECRLSGLDRRCAGQSLGGFMNLSYADAGAAMTAVLTEYDRYLSADLKLKLASKTASDIFVFCDAATYASKFDITWYCVFKKAINSLNKDYSASTVPGFCSSEKDRLSRKIFLQQGVCDNPCTYHHEFIHYLSHQDFYPIYYTVGGNAPFQVEGVTEFATRSISTQIAQTRHGRYENNYNKTVSWVGNSPEKKSLVLTLLFQGTGVEDKARSQAVVATGLAKILP
jgi:hypothetical protein